MEIIVTKTFEDLGTTYEVGTRHHVATSVAERYIQHKVADRYKYKSVAERLSSEEAERQRSLPQIPVTVQWACVKGMLSERYYISAKCSRANCTALAYDAPPSAALEAITFLHSCGGYAPEQIPAAICDQYRKLFKPAALVGADLVNYYKNCQPSKGDGRPVDLYAPQTINGVVVGPPALSDHPVNPQHNNYGWENFRPNPGDGQPVDHSKLKLSSSKEGSSVTFSQSQGSGKGTENSLWQSKQKYRTISIRQSAAPFARRRMVIAGRALSYNTLSNDLGGFKERLQPGCFSRHLATTPDVLCRREHETGFL